MARTRSAASGIRVGIVAALPVECAAVRLFIDDPHDLSVRDDPNHYCSGRMPSKHPHSPHPVVVALQTTDGTRSAAAVCTDMARSFPGLQVFIMCGIAGATRAPGKGIGLGDVAVATEGIVDYDHVRTVDGNSTLRRPVGGLSTALLRADRELATKEYLGEEPWRLLTEQAVTRAAGFRRPRESPSAGDRPYVHRGAIGSADRLLRDAVQRDLLAIRHKIIAVEMEGSGIAVGADLRELHWFMVRGIADFCDNLTKNDVWHRNAALMAAAYTRALLAECLPFESSPSESFPVESNGSLAGIESIVDELLTIPQMRDDYQRRAIVAPLPDYIRTAIPDNVVARLHVIGLIQTCEQYPDGRDALISVLRLALGAGSPEFSRVESVIRDNWSGR